MAGSKTGPASLPETEDDGAGRWHRLRDAAERSALAAAAVLTVAVLLVVFYYPVSRVFIEAILVEGQVTLQVFWAILTDPFYTGEVGRVLSGASPVGAVERLFTGRARQGVIGFTAYQAALSTVASVALGLPGAYLLARYEFRGRTLLRSLTMLPFVLPSMMVAVGFVATFGSRGTLNAALGTFGLGQVEVLYTLEAIVIAHAFYNAPLVIRMTTAAWESVDAGAVETARSLGASPLHAFRTVVAPQLLPAVVMSAALTFVFTFGSFPIVLALGGYDLVTVEVFVFQLIDQFDYAEAAALALIELTISLSLMYAYLRYEARQAGRTRGARPLARRSLLPDRLTPREVLPRLGLAAYAVVAGLVFLAPIASMVYASVSGPAGLTLDHFQFLVERQTTGAAFQVRPLPAVLNSLQFAAASLALALPMGVVVAVLTTRNYRGRSLVGAAAMAPLAVSGIVVGLGLLRGLVFGVEVGGHRIAIDGAAAIIAAHAVAGYPFVVRVVAPGMDRLDPSLVESARALGAPRVRALIDIELPLVWPAVVAGAAFAFAISIGEFTSTAVLASSTGQYTMPIAIQRFIGRRLGPATAMGVVLLAVTAVSFVCIEWLGGERDGL